MFKNANCHVKAFIVNIAFMLVIALPVKAQKKSAISAGLLYGSSMLTFNQNSDKFDKRIANELINYLPVQNFGIAVGYSVWLSERNNA